MKKEVKEVGCEKRGGMKKRVLDMMLQSGTSGALVSDARGDVELGAPDEVWEEQRHGEAPMPLDGLQSSSLEGAELAPHLLDGFTQSCSAIRHRSLPCKGSDSASLRSPSLCVCLSLLPFHLPVFLSLSSLALVDQSLCLTTTRKKLLPPPNGTGTSTSSHGRVRSSNME